MVFQYYYLSILVLFELYKYFISIGSKNVLFKEAIRLDTYMSYMVISTTNFHNFIFLIRDFDDTCIVYNIGTYINTN